jgi:hypothetical protein
VGVGVEGGVRGWGGGRDDFLQQILEKKLGSFFSSLLPVPLPLPFPFAQTSGSSP